MVYQYWVKSDHWEEHDPKLKQLRESPVQLPHTQRLADSIALKPPGILTVRGPRQTGKSTFLRQFACKCLAKGVAPDSLGLIDAERCESWQVLLSEMEPFLKQNKRGAILLIDEITTVDQWWKAIKIAADDGLTLNSLVLCTGSNAMDLVRGADLLPGRRGKRHPVDIELLPVCYNDVAEELKLHEFLLTGGMPWAISEFLRHGFVPSYVYALYAAWIEGALVKNRHTRVNLAHMLNYIARRIGSTLSVTSLARECGIGSNSTAEGIISTLENNYALLVSWWSAPGSTMTAPRKNRKFFAADPLIFHLFSDFGRGWEFTWETAQKDLDDPEKVSRIVENVVASQLRHNRSMYPLRYYLGRKEIDFIGNEFIEVKYQNNVSIAEFAWAKKLIPSQTTLTVITKQSRARDETVNLVPLNEWLVAQG